MNTTRYIIEQGRVEVVRKGSLVNTLDAGDLFGELALIYDIPRQATCSLVTEHATLWRLDRADFEKFLKKNATITTLHGEEFYRSYDNALADRLASERSLAIDQKLEAVLKRIQTLAGSPEENSFFVAGSLEETLKKTLLRGPVEAAGRGQRLPILDPVEGNSSAPNGGAGKPKRKQPATTILTYYVARGGGLLFEGHGISGSSAEGELLGEDFLDPEFADFLDGTLRLECASEGSVFWPIQILCPRIAQFVQSSIEEGDEEPALVTRGAAGGAGGAAAREEDEVLQAAVGILLQAVYKSVLAMLLVG